MAELDTIRKERKKFVCLNDNIDHEKEGADLVGEEGREGGEREGGGERERERFIIFMNN